MIPQMKALEDVRRVGEEVYAIRHEIFDDPNAVYRKILKMGHYLKIAVGELPPDDVVLEPLYSEGQAEDVQRRMDAVVDAAVAWHLSGQEGDDSWLAKADILGQAIDDLLALRGVGECKRPVDSERGVAED